MQTTGLLVVVMTLSANAFAFWSKTLSPVMRSAVLIGVAFNIHMRLHPEVLANGAPPRPGSNPESLLWPGKLFWRWMGTVTALHALYAVSRDASPLVLQMFASGKEAMTTSDLVTLASTALVAYMAAGYTIQFVKP